MVTIPFHLLQFTFQDKKTKKAADLQGLQKPEEECSKIRDPKWRHQCLKLVVWQHPWGREQALERQQSHYTLSFTHSLLVTLSSKAFIIIRFSPAPVVMDFFFLIMQIENHIFPLPSTGQHWAVRLIHSFNKYWWCPISVPGTVLGAVNLAGIKINKNPCPRGPYISLSSRGETGNKQNK